MDVNKKNHTTYYTIYYINTFKLFKSYYLQGFNLLYLATKFKMVFNIQKILVLMFSNKENKTFSRERAVQFGNFILKINAVHRFQKNCELMYNACVLIPNSLFIFCLLLIIILAINKKEGRNENEKINFSNYSNFLFFAFDT